MKFKLSLIAALSLFTCSAIHCGIESAEDKKSKKEFTQEEKQLVFKTLCKKGDYDEENLENAPISCACYQQLDSAVNGLRARIWHSQKMKEEGLQAADKLSRLKSSADVYVNTKCDKFNDSFYRYYGKLCYADEVQRERGDKEGASSLRKKMSQIDDTFNAINAHAVSDALEAAKINVPLATAAFVVSTIAPSQEKRDE